MSDQLSIFILLQTNFLLILSLSRVVFIVYSAFPQQQESKVPYWSRFHLGDSYQHVLSFIIHHPSFIIRLKSHSRHHHSGFIINLSSPIYHHHLSPIIYHQSSITNVHQIGSSMQHYIRVCFLCFFVLFLQYFRFIDVLIMRCTSSWYNYY